MTRPLIYPFDNQPALRILTPAPYQVIQRNAWAAGSGTAGILITGTYRGGAKGSVEVRYRGGAWTTLDAAPANGRFTGTLAGQTVGQGLLEVRWSARNDVTASAAMVGVGDVILGYGQSNMSGRATNNQTWSNATYFATLFGNDSVFKLLADPWDSQAGSLWSINNDLAAAGSCIPALATPWMADRLCPVMFVPCPLGSTTISQWQPNTDHRLPSTLYGAMIMRGDLTKPGFAIFHLGESDAVAMTTKLNFKNGFRTVADALLADLAVKTFAAILQNSSGAADVNEQDMRDAVTELVAEAGSVLLGADVSDQTSDDTFHLMTDVKITLLGTRWFAAIKAVMGA